MKIQKIGHAKILEEVIEYLQETNDTAEFLVLRSFRDETGTKHLEYWTSGTESRVWIVGALYYLSHKLLASDSEDEEDD